MRRPRRWQRKNQLGASLTASPAWRDVTGMTWRHVTATMRRDVTPRRGCDCSINELTVNDVTSHRRGTLNEPCSVPEESFMSMVGGQGLSSATSTSFHHRTRPSSIHSTPYRLLPVRTRQSKLNFAARHC